VTCCWGHRGGVDLHTDLLIINLGARRGEVYNAKPQPFYPGEYTPVFIVRETGWAPGPVLTDVSGAVNTIFTEDLKCDTT